MFALGGASLDLARASCAPPSAQMSPTRARPGDTVRITGEGWNDTCDDTEAVSCSGSDPRPADRPTEGIDIDLKRVGEPARTRVLEDVDADERFRIDATFTVPALPPGRYKVIVHHRGSGGDLGDLLRIVEG